MGKSRNKASVRWGYRQAKSQKLPRARLALCFKANRKHYRIPNKRWKSILQGVVMEKFYKKVLDCVVGGSFAAFFLLYSLHLLDVAFQNLKMGILWFGWSIEITALALIFLSWVILQFGVLR
jgi:hypothetical protein